MNTSSTSANQLKELVRDKYSEIAEQSRTQNATSCCGATCGCSTTTDIMAEDYTSLEGYLADADLGLGCGIPTEYADIKKGDTVLDLGSGAGNDAFVARSIVGETGRVIGVDFTPVMVQKARANAAKLGLTNVEFVEGDIEHMPLPENTADVIVSNCVLNLVPNKAAAFKEIFRVMKKGGHFSISDIVHTGDLPESVRKSAEMYAGCVAGAVSLAEYIILLRDTGFKNVEVRKQRAIEIPEESFKGLGDESLDAFKSGKSGIFSITVYGEKPEACCGPGCCN